MIEKNLNAVYYNEKKMEEFFENVFCIKKPHQFLQDSHRMQKFFYEDLKKII